MLWASVFWVGISGFLGEKDVPLWAELNFDLKMGTNKTCRIFLASSVDEMKKQRTDFGDFIRKFADIYRPRGVDITLVKCEDLRLAYSGRRTQDMLNDEVAQSDVLVTLFYKKCGKDTVREFEVGRASLAARNKPFIIVALKNTKVRTPELDAFTSRLSNELHMYYWRFGTTDKLHFDFVMWFLQSEFAVGGDPVIVENGTVKVDDLPVAQLSLLPFAANNTEYQRLEQQLAELEKDIEKLRQNIKKYPDDEDFSEQLSQKYLAREALQQESQRQQDALLGAAKRIAELRKQKVSEKLEQAIELFESGDMRDANALFRDIEKESVSIDESFEKDRQRIHQLIDAALIQTSTEMSITETPIEKRIDIIAGIFAKADDRAKRSAYPEEKYEKLLFDYAQFLYDYARYPEAVEVYLRQISLSEKLYGTDHPNTATSYNNLGLVYDNQGAYAQALEYYNKALEIREKVLGKDHPDTATDYNNIGAVFYSQGAYAQALEYYNKALEIQEKLLGEDHPYTATSYNNIAGVYYNQGVYSQALEYFNKALAIREKVLGKDHPDIATSYNNIGAVYKEQGAYSQALDYYNKALEIVKKVLGKDHPYTATSYNNIGLVYDAQGVYDQALEYYNKAFAIDEKVLGKDHPGTATDYNNIGWVYREQGDYKQALVYFEKAHAIRQQKLGDDHPDTKDVKLSIKIVKGKLAGSDGRPWWRRLLSGLFGK